MRCGTVICCVLDITFKFNALRYLIIKSTHMEEGDVIYYIYYRRASCFHSLCNRYAYILCWCMKYINLYITQKTKIHRMVYAVAAGEFIAFVALSTTT